MRRRAPAIFVACAWLAACSGGVENPTPPGGNPANPAAGNGAPGSMTRTPGQPGSTATGSKPPAAPVDCDRVQVSPRRLWRLTPNQYDNTITDLFGIQSTFGQGFPADEVVRGFSNNADSLIVTPLYADKLQAAAQDISGKAELQRLVPCAAAAKDDNCLRELATKFGEKMFRRPVQPAEADRYVTLAKTAGDFEAGARLMLLAFLQSPNFLYRFEIGKPDKGTRFALTDYEIASELSYMLWQTTPDDALLAAAKSGMLHEPAQVRAQVDRMLMSPRAKPVVRAFVFEWLGLTAVTTVPKDTMRFPELTPEIRAALLAEAERFVDHVMFASGNSLSALLTTPSTYLDAALATFYGVAGQADPMTPVTLPDQGRRGILTLGATMLTHARSNDSSPVHRGKLVRERLLCQILPPPPAGLNVQPPPLDPSKTTRERYKAHSSMEPCQSCHRLMDPIGLSFEHFDGIGRFRATDNGMPIDAHGEILDSKNSDAQFDGVSELIDVLDGSPDVEACYSLSWLRFAYGLTERDESACVVERMQGMLSAGEGSLASIFAALTQADQFYARSGDPTYVPPPQTDQPNLEPGTSTTAGTPADAEAQPGLDVQVTQNNDWGMGYCKTYSLKNTSTAPITWSVALTVDGKMNNHWECEVSGDTGIVTFSGVSHNATLNAGATGQFGFCATR
jgi:Protein of unknown function (DUF1592)/Protein of unknown function (DUF1588)/Protein of unknown function (DUF1587)/Protein of unknown function (DUF1595)/Cellulose binding domain/Protein of unknown function (DUF1585)